ncbi:MAG: hypothetical protein HOQ43_10800 [Glycomyces artemisiae]|uniref:Uncharacterized protein n=1 Tax=Glycomyces artemisiae TaxID=1076443 RepID=A0A850C6P2_9ACTN|nr:hypothetical protein [Glycomyces artemisiae]
MADPMTPGRLSELTAAAEAAATPPWSTLPITGHSLQGTYVSSFVDIVCAEAGAEDVASGVHVDDAALIVAAPELLAEVTRLHAEAEQSRQAIDTYVGALAVERAEVERLRPMEAALAAEHAALELSEAEVRQLRAQVASLTRELEHATIMCERPNNVCMRKRWTDGGAGDE